MCTSEPACLSAACPDRPGKALLKRERRHSPGTAAISTQESKYKTGKQVCNRSLMGCLKLFNMLDHTLPTLPRNTSKYSNVTEQ